MINFIKEGLIARLDYIKRFNGQFKLHEEAVSTHSYWVVFYCNLLFRDLFWLAFKDSADTPYGVIPDLNAYHEMYNFLMRQAIMHDVDEVFASDVLFDVKYHESGGDDVRKGLRSIVLSEINAMRPSVLKLELVAQYSSDTQHGTTSLTTEQKAICHNIIKLCDWLSSYQFCHEEVVTAGNTTFDNILQRVIEGIRTCRVSLLGALEASHLPFSQSAIESII
jgi:5'-deoxynucleotidase YfbR-like HD superfamily hydrolase